MKASIMLQIYFLLLFLLILLKLNFNNKLNEALLFQMMKYLCIVKYQFLKRLIYLKCLLINVFQDEVPLIQIINLPLHMKLLPYHLNQFI